MASDPSSHDHALKLVVARLNDSGFLRSAASRAESRPQQPPRNQDRAPDRRATCNEELVPSPQFNRRQDGDRPPPLVQRAQGPPNQEAAARQLGQPASARLVKPTPSVVCARCKRPGHSESACISKHDVNGAKLERQDAEVYAKRKELAVKNAASKESHVNAVGAESDSDSSDVDRVEDNLFADEAHQDDYADDGVYGVYPIEDYSPPPSLLLCGDIESNPGPHMPKTLRSMPVFPSRRPFELEASTTRPSVAASLLLYVTIIHGMCSLIAWLTGIKQYQRYTSVLHSALDKEISASTSTINNFYHSKTNRSPSKHLWILVGVICVIELSLLLRHTPVPCLVGVEPGPDQLTRFTVIPSSRTQRFYVHLKEVTISLSCEWYRLVLTCTSLLWLFRPILLTSIPADITPAPRLVGVEPNPGPAPPSAPSVPLKRCLLCSAHIPVFGSLLSHQCAPSMLPPNLSTASVPPANEGHLAGSPLPQMSQLHRSHAGGVPPHPGSGQRRLMGRGPNAIAMKSPSHVLGSLHSLPKCSIVSVAQSKCSILSPVSEFVHPHSTVSVAERSIYGSAPKKRTLRPLVDQALVDRAYRYVPVAYRPTAPSLLRCGDIEANPGPTVLGMPALVSDSDTSDSDEDAPVILKPQARQSPAASSTAHRQRNKPPASAFVSAVHASAKEVKPDVSSPATPFLQDSDPLLFAVCPSAAAANKGAEHKCDNILPSPSRTIEADVFDIESEEMQILSLNTVLNYLSSSDDSDTSDLDSPELPTVAATATHVATLLPPPKFVGFLTATDAPMPPPMHSAQECAVDTMCQGEFSIISQSLATKLSLPCIPFTRSSRTASGAVVTCSSMAVFALAIFVRGSWISLPVKALVWEKAAQPILLSNSFALETGIIDFVQPNPERAAIFGDAIFSRDYESKIRNHEDKVLAAYHEDVMPEEFDDIVDLAAPTRLGDQDVSTLPADAMVYAKRYPSMTKAIPKDAHPSLPKWRANVCVDRIPLYSWPTCDLKDLKEDKIPFRVVPQLHREFDKLIEMHYVEPLTECPTAIVMRAQLVAKSKTEKRFCVNGSVFKNVMQVIAYPMPHIRSIFIFVSEFPYRAKIDAKHGYHNFEVHEDDRKYTCTIGGGRAVQWRKLVQGFASSGAFFQYAICNLLGPAIVWVICAVYLDDIIVVGKTFEECVKNVDIVMAKLAAVRFRINFAKCSFTPSSTIEFLGCKLVGQEVHPGPKVSAMLSKIKPPHLQPTPKSQRHHLYVYLGCCAFIMQHCPGLKQILAPLYKAVASDPYVYGEIEREAFERSHAMLSSLQPYHLPSADPEYVVEIMTDASGGSGSVNDTGAWAAVLGQRKGAFNAENPADGFEILQTDGGVFNERQSQWDILRKEANALFHAMVRFRQYIFGRRVRLIVDSKVLMHMFRSENSMIKRWYAFIQTFDTEMIHVSTDRNQLADCLSRYTTIPPRPATRTPRLLQAVGAVIAPCLTQCGDVEPNPGPDFEAPQLLPAVCAVIAPPLTDCGDIESNPGPASDDDRPIVLLSSDSASPPTVPVQQLERRRRTETTATAASPSGKPTPARRRKAPVARTASAAAVPSPQPPTTGRQRQQAATAEEPQPRIPAQLLIQDPHDAEREPNVTVRLQTIALEASTSSLSLAVASALTADTETHGRILVKDTPSGSTLIREQVMWFLNEYPNVCCSVTPRMSPLDLFKQSLSDGSLSLQFDHREGTHVPTTWAEYCTLMADNGTFPDQIFLLACARTYRCQIIALQPDDTFRIISPPNAFRRIFLLRCVDSVNWNWGKIVPDTAEGFDISIFAPPLNDMPNPLRPRPDEVHSLYRNSPDNEEHLRQLHRAHCGYTGHPGVEVTVRFLVAAGHKWRGMLADAAQFIRRCPTCCSSRLRLHYAPTSPSSIRLHARPLSRWHIDQTGPITECCVTGFNRFIVFICEATQFCVLYGSKFGTAMEIAIALVSVMGWFGLPESLHSDNGSENDNYIWRQMQQITGIKHTFSMPFIPQTNGIAERGIQTCKRILRTLSVDIGRHNSWGLLLPIAQKGANDLKREELSWYSPAEIVFASCNSGFDFAVPAFYHRPLNAADLADANHYHVSGNFGHRVMYFQQEIVNTFHELQRKAREHAAASAPIDAATLRVGQAVLIDWPQLPPSPQHPSLRGPYRVLDVRRNVVQLQHLCVPPPDDQAEVVTWSLQARIYVYPDDYIPSRSALNPSSSHVATGFSTRHIECILSHSLSPSLDRRSVGRLLVTNQVYECRLFSSDAPRSHTQLVISCVYDDIKHTLAFDNYVATTNLTGHVPTSQLPINWQHAVMPSSRPMHRPSPTFENEVIERPDSDSDTSDV